MAKSWSYTQEQTSHREERNFLQDQNYRNRLALFSVVDCSMHFLGSSGNCSNGCWIYDLDLSWSVLMTNSKGGFWSFPLAVKNIIGWQEASSDLWWVVAESRVILWLLWTTHSLQSDSRDWIKLPQYFCGTSVNLILVLALALRQWHSVSTAIRDDIQILQDTKNPIPQSGDK